MFREIRTSERITEEDKRRNEAYRNIKPEKEISYEELNKLVLEMFNQAANEVK